MMLPGVEYVAYAVTIATWLVVSSATAMVVAILPVRCGAMYFVEKTKTYNDKVIGNVPPNGKRKWPWWTEAHIWTKIGFWIFFAVFGYTFAGPTWGILTMIGGA